MTPELNEGINALVKEFAAEIANGDIVHLGITNCRYKNNNPDDGWSEHAWSNAVDVMLRNWPGRKALGDRIAKWMRAHPELWSEVFWQIAAHFDHVHGTANPRRSVNGAIPPCAGGPPGGGDDMISKTLNQAQWERLFDLKIVSGASKAAVVDYWVTKAAQRGDDEHARASASIFLALAEKTVGLQRGDIVKLV